MLRGTLEGGVLGGDPCLWGAPAGWAGLVRRERVLQSPRLTLPRARLTRSGLRGMRPHAALSLQTFLTAGSLEATLWVLSPCYPAHPTYLRVSRPGSSLVPLRAALG